MIPLREEFEVFSYEGRDISFTIYMALFLGELLSNRVGFMATVYIGDIGLPIVVTRDINIDIRSTAGKSVIEQYVSMQIARGLNDIFRQIVLYALPNKYVPKRMAEKTWGLCLE